MERVSNNGNVGDNECYSLLFLAILPLVVTFHTDPWNNVSHIHVIIIYPILLKYFGIIDHKYISGFHRRTQVFRKDKEFLVHWWWPTCYSFHKPGDNSLMRKCRFPVYVCTLQSRSNKCLNLIIYLAKITNSQGAYFRRLFIWLNTKYALLYCVYRGKYKRNFYSSIKCISRNVVCHEN